jgi:ABC-type phosphate/phosphonate transport system substrate-binding protein
MQDKDADMHLRTTLTAGFIATTIATAPYASRAQPAPAPSEIQVPILNFLELRDAPKERWQGLEQAISRELGAPVRFIIEQNNKTAWRALHERPPVFMTTALAAARLSEATGSIPIAAINRHIYGHLAGGAIIVRRDSKIHTADQLAGRTILAVRRDVTHGYSLQADWARKRGVNPDTLSVYGAPSYFDIVRMVLEGRADAGFIRAGFLEHLASNGAPGLDQLSVLEGHRNAVGNIATTQSLPDAIISVRRDLAPETIDRLKTAILALRIPNVLPKSSDPYGFVHAPDLGTALAFADAIGYSLRDPNLPYEQGAKFPPLPNRGIVGTAVSPAQQPAVAPPPAISATVPAAMPLPSGPVPAPLPHPPPLVPPTAAPPR